MNVEITPEARDELSKIMEMKPEMSFRLFVEGFGWGGPRVGMALDEPTETDSRLDVAGIPVIISKDEESYIGYGGGLRVHYVTGRMGTGFTVSRSSAYDFGC